MKRFLILIILSLSHLILECADKKKPKKEITINIRDNKSSKKIVKTIKQPKRRIKNVIIAGDWITAFVKNKISEKEQNLIAQYIFYKTLRLKLLVKSKQKGYKPLPGEPTLEHFNEILLDIKQKLSKSAQERIKDMNKNFKKLSDEDDNENKILKLIEFIVAHYIFIYNNIKNKTVTIGFKRFKGKPLPTPKEFAKYLPTTEELLSLE